MISDEQLKQLVEAYARLIKARAAYERASVSAAIMTPLNIYRDYDINLWRAHEKRQEEVDQTAAETEFTRLLGEAGLEDEAAFIAYLERFVAERGISLNS